jgi:hypothetical protein
MAWVALRWDLVRWPTARWPSSPTPTSAGSPISFIARRHDFHNGREYERFAGQTILMPRAAADQPDRALLDWHEQEVFRG